MIVVLMVLVLLAGCAAKQPDLPPVHPVPNDLAAFQVPVLVNLPPEEPPPLPTPPRKAPGKQELRYQWADGDSYDVPVGISFPTVVRFHAGEKITSFVDGDREYLSEAEAEHTPKAPDNKNCFFAARWQYCKGTSGAAGSAYAPVDHLAVTTTHHGKKQGLVVFTDQRAYYLDLHAVKQAKHRLVTFDVPLPPLMPPKQKPPGIFPARDDVRDYHTGYTFTVPDPVPSWTPLKVYSDTKMYLLFSPTVLHQRMPLIRGVNGTGPHLLNMRQVHNWVIIDELAERLELRMGPGEDAQVVVITRGPLRTVACPGDQDCPVWPY